MQQDTIRHMHTHTPTPTFLTQTHPSYTYTTTQIRFTPLNVIRIEVTFDNAPNATDREIGHLMPIEVLCHTQSHP